MTSHSPGTEAYARPPYATRSRDIRRLVPARAGTTKAPLLESSGAFVDMG